MAETAPAVTPGFVRTTVPVPGLGKPVRILHATDVHICRPDADSPPSCTEVHTRWKGEKVEERVEALFALIEKETVDALVLTGDVVHFPTRNSLDWVRARLDRVRAPVYYIPGNHDTNFPSLPWDAAIREEYLPRLAPLFEPRPPTIVDRWDVGGLQFVSVDDSTYQILPRQLAAVREAFATGRPTVLLMHIPLTTPELLPRVLAKWKSPILLGEPVEQIAAGFLAQPTRPETAEFLALIRASKNVRAILAGHVHFEHAEKYTPDTLQLVGPPGYDGLARLIDFVPA